MEAAHRCGKALGAGWRQAQVLGEPRSGVVNAGRWGYKAERERARGDRGGGAVGSRPAGTRTSREGAPGPPTEGTQAPACKSSSRGRRYLIRFNGPTGCKWRANREMQGVKADAVHQGRAAAAGEDGVGAGEGPGKTASRPRQIDDGKREKQESR